MPKIDLHIHSAYSNDGEFEVIDLVNRCVAQNVEVFALSDHNTVRGVDEAIRYAKEASLDFIPAIEIDCVFEGIDLHLLGYQIDWRSNDFSCLEAEVYKKTMGALGAMVDNLVKLGFVIDLDTVLERANGKLPAPELIAEIMLGESKYNSPRLTPYRKGGVRGDMPYINFYLDYFEQGKPAYVPIDFMSFEDAVEMIRANGGIPIVAHPGRNLRGCESMSKKLLDRGAEGLEVFNNYHTPQQSRYFASLVMEQAKIMTCGSDFHGKNKPLINIGNYYFETQFDSYLHQSVTQLKR